jgi:hypothetical protein
MAELKTVPTTQDIDEYIATLPEKRQKEAYQIIEIMERVSGYPPVVWGSNIIGFGQTHLVYDSGREIDYFITGFAMRKQKITIYLSIETNKKVFDELGKHAKGVGCLYINRLEDVDLHELEVIIKESVESLALWKSV